MFATLTRRVTASLVHLVALTMCTKTMDVDVEVDTEMRAEVEEVLGIVLVDPMFATLGRTMNVIRAIHAGSTISRIVPAVMTEVARASPVRKGGREISCAAETGGAPSAKSTNLDSVRTVKSVEARRPMMQLQRWTKSSKRMRRLDSPSPFDQVTGCAPTARTTSSRNTIRAPSVTTRP